MCFKKNIFYNIRNFMAGDFITSNTDLILNYYYVFKTQQNICNYLAVVPIFMYFLRQ